MSSIGASGGHHINPQEIMQWVATHTGKMGEQIANEMEGAERRLEVIDKLLQAKQTMLQTNKDGTHLGEASKQLDDILATCKEDPALADLVEEYQPVADQLHQALAGQGSSDPAKKAAYDQLFSSGILNTFSDKMSASAESLKSKDQIGMLRLQDASSQINQSMHLATNLMAGINTTAMAIVGNFRG